MDDENHDREVDVHRTRYDEDGAESFSYAIVRAIGAVRGTEPEAVQPLFESVDPDALERLFRSFRESDDDPPTGSIRFSAGDCRVRIDADGTITIRHPRPSAGGDE